ncbi:hypothetical protein EJB05_22259 [Eragrostis curvula]|uniref:Uncharacterized protein n=1 Tax=Eragrostis curvula TaxID=38414 RepID=A0A5J9V545_9POAL|nr:hypothetical protein EJB05_22259 [Eragrostis curvula]
MVVALLRQVKDALGPLFGKEEVIQELEFALITKVVFGCLNESYPVWDGSVDEMILYRMVQGDMTQREALWLEAIRSIAREGFIRGSAMYSFMAWFGVGIACNEHQSTTILLVLASPLLLVEKDVGSLEHNLHFITSVSIKWLKTIGASTYEWFEIHPVCCWALLRIVNPVVGGAFITGKIIYYANLRNYAMATLYSKEERMKMELANIILNKHSDEKSLVQAVKGQFFAEHLFSDLHQDTPVFRWHPRHSYTDRAFVERMKEIEAETDDASDEARSASRRTTLNIRSFGDLEDPLACILGSPGGDMDSDNPSEITCAVQKRSNLRAHRKRHRHRRHQYADKFVAM